MDRETMEADLVELKRFRRQMEDSKTFFSHPMGGHTGKYLTPLVTTALDKEIYKCSRRIENIEIQLEILNVRR